VADRRKRKKRSPAFWMLSRTTGPELPAGHLRAALAEEDLAAQRGAAETPVAPSPRSPDAAAFINRAAAPIVNKMFDGGMIP